MIYFCIIIFLLIIFCILYLNVHQKKIKIFTIFFFVAISTSVIYFIQGSPESLNFNKNLETEISEFITNENIEKLDSSKIILFLERELKDNPNDKEDG